MSEISQGIIPHLCEYKKSLAGRDSPKQSDTSLRGGGHGAVIIDGVLSWDVVLQEQALWIFLLQCVPLPWILRWKGRKSEMILLTFLLASFKHVCVFLCTHPLGVKVLFDCEAVDDTGGRQTALHAGQQDQQQGQLRGCHSIMNIHISVLGPETGCVLLNTSLNLWMSLFHTKLCMFVTN